MKKVHLIYGSGEADFYLASEVDAQIAALKWERDFWKAKTELNLLMYYFRDVGEKEAYRIANEKMTAYEAEARAEKAGQG